MKTWRVQTSSNENFEIKGTRVDLDTNQARATFFNGDETIASFVGLNGFVLVGDDQNPEF